MKLLIYTFACDCNVTNNLCFAFRKLKKWLAVIRVVMNIAESILKNAAVSVHIVDWLT